MGIENGSFYANNTENNLSKIYTPLQLFNKLFLHRLIIFFGIPFFGAYTQSIPLNEINPYSAIFWFLQAGGFYLTTRDIKSLIKSFVHEGYLVKLKNGNLHSKIKLRSRKALKKTLQTCKKNFESL